MNIRISGLTLFIAIICQSQATYAILAAEPTVQTSSLSASSTSCNEIDLTWTNGDGAKRIIIASANAPVSILPSDGVGYTAGTVFGSGSNLGSGNYVVYNQTGNSVTVTGLQGGTLYYFAAFEFNGSLTGTNYLTTTYPEANTTALGFSLTVFSSSGGMCAGDSVQLEVHGADTYLWSPSSTLSSDTDSVVWAKPSNSVSYNVVGTEISSGCTNSKNISVSVYQLPNVSIGTYSNKCVNASTFTLTSGSPMGGVYSGTGVSAGIFNPGVAGVGQHVITYTYTDIHSCSSADTSNIVVVATPVVTLATFNDVCIDDPQFTLSGGDPSGGSYSGTGVSSGHFNPATAGVGQHLIRYVYSSGCTDTAEAYIRVRSLPTVNFATIPSACLNTPPFTFTQGTPAGGTYTGNGVTNNQFTPLVTGAGTFLITYTFSDSIGCGNSDTSYITISTIPSVGFSTLNPICQNTGPVTLTGGTPSGGTYSGTAVGSGIFYSGIAGPGQHAITYSFTDNHSCTNTATQQMTVNAIPHPNLGSDQIVCQNQSAYLTAGSYSSYFWSTGANSIAINVDTTGRGLGTFAFVLTVTNQFTCANKDTVLVTFDGCVGIDEFDAKNFGDASVYPNPTTNYFNISSKHYFDLNIYDVRGELILEEKNLSATFSIGEELPRGIYLLKLFFDDVIVNKLLIKN